MINDILITNNNMTQYTVCKAPFKGMYANTARQHVLQLNHFCCTMFLWFAHGYNIHYCSPYITRNLLIANYKYSLKIELHKLFVLDIIPHDSFRKYRCIKEGGNELDINVTLYNLNLPFAFQDGIYVHTQEYHCTLNIWLNLWLYHVQSLLTLHIYGNIALHIPFKPYD